MSYLTVYQPNYLAIGVIDDFKSLLWTERYSECGDFELCCSVRPELLSLLSIGNYLMLTGSQQSMIIETVEIKTDIEEGNLFYVTGRSAESVLDRRIIWNQTSFAAGRLLEWCIYRLVRDNISNQIPTSGSDIPSVNLKRIVWDFEIFYRYPSGMKTDLFSYIDKYRDNSINWSNTLEALRGSRGDNSLTLEALKEEFALYDLYSLTEVMQFFGENLYDSVKSLCEILGFGFRVGFHPEDECHRFYLYSGTDHSYDQSSNSVVIFSTKFDNLISSDYHESYQDYKNVAWVQGEDRGGSYYRSTSPEGCPVSETYGLRRREMFVNASDISWLIEYVDPITEKVISIDSVEEYSQKEYAVGDYCWIDLNDDRGKNLYRCITPIATAEAWNPNHWEYIKGKYSNDEYAALLTQRGRQELAENSIYATFEGQMIETSQYKYNIDFKMGDIVQVENEFGMRAKTRIKEIIHSYDENGESVYPTFAII